MVIADGVSPPTLSDRETCLVCKTPKSQTPGGFQGNSIRYRGTLLMSKRPPLGPKRKHMHMALQGYLAQKKPPPPQDHHNALGTGLL